MTVDILPQRNPQYLPARRVPPGPTPPAVRYPQSGWGTTVVGKATNHLRHHIHTHLDGNDPEWALSHTSAWQWHGYFYPPSLRHQTQLTVSTWQGSGQIRRAGVHSVRRKTRPETTIVRGVRTTTAAQSWCDLAATKPDLFEYIASAEHYVGCDPRRLGLLHQHAKNHGRQSGARLIRQALAQVQLCARSPMSTLVRLQLAASGLPEPHWHVALAVRGQFTWQVEVCYPHAKIVLCCADVQPKLAGAQQHRFVQEREFLTACGYLVWRLTDADLLDPRQLWVHHLRTALAERSVAHPQWVGR